MLTAKFCTKKNIIILQRLHRESVKATQRAQQIGKIVRKVKSLNLIFKYFIKKLKYYKIYTIMYAMLGKTKQKESIIFSLLSRNSSFPNAYIYIIACKNIKTVFIIHACNTMCFLKSFTQLPVYC